MSIPCTVYLKLILRNSLGTGGNKWDSAAATVKINKQKLLKAVSLVNYSEGSRLTS